MHQKEIYKELDSLYELANEIENEFKRLLTKKSQNSEKVNFGLTTEEQGQLILLEHLVKIIHKE